MSSCSFSISDSHTSEDVVIDFHQCSQSYSASVSGFLLTEFHNNCKRMESIDLPILKDSSSKIDIPSLDPAGGDGGNNSST